jgi:hypothetical protein
VKVTRVQDTAKKELLAEKDKLLAEKDKLLAEKDKLLAEVRAAHFEERTS